MKALYTRAALLMAGILLICVLLTALTGVQVPQAAEGLRVTASFYPVYVAAMNVIGEVPGVSLQCLAQPQTGCLHDYQLTPSDRQLLEQTDVLLLNGAGAEEFLEATLAELPAVTVVDTAAGLTLLPAGEEHPHEEGHGHEELYNEHTWISPVCYAAQVNALAEGLAQADPAHAQIYRDNARRYGEQIAAVADELTQAVRVGGYGECLLFSESLAYLARDLGLQALYTLSIGESSQLSAAELAAAEQAIRDKKVLLLYDAQYDQLYTYLREFPAECRVLSIDTAVRGDLTADAWLRAMQQTAAALRGDEV